MTPDAIEPRASESDVVEKLHRVAGDLDGDLDGLEGVQGDRVANVIAASQAVYRAILELESA